MRNSSRDDLPTLRVTNISEDTGENDLRELFGNFGRVARVYVGRDRETGMGKGFAFVSFEDRAVAQKAMEKVHGRGYDNLILNVQWSRKYFSSLHLQVMEINALSRASARGKIVADYMMLYPIHTLGCHQFRRAMERPVAIICNVFPKH